VELIDTISCDYMQGTINFALYPARLDSLKKVSEKCTDSGSGRWNGLTKLYSLSYLTYTTES
jgi:hypothetical protein